MQKNALLYWLLSSDVSIEGPLEIALKAIKSFALEGQDIPKMQLLSGSLDNMPIRQVIVQDNA